MSFVAVHFLAFLNWLDFTPQWCTVSGRASFGYQNITAEQCKEKCKDALVWSGGKNHATDMSVLIPPKRPRIRTVMTPVIPLTCSLKATIEKDLPLCERFY